VGIWWAKELYQSEPIPFECVVKSLWNQRPLLLLKNGKADLRYALYQAALITSFKNIHFMRYYTNRIRGREKERGIKTKMRVKLAAKLLIIAWTLMKKEEPFSPDYLNIE